MRNVRILLGIIIALVLASCGPTRKTIIPELDKPFARYPSYRIDDKMQRISIIGSGTGNLEITSFLTKLFVEASNIKVIESGNLQAILGGKVIEYHTNLTESESQRLAQMLQIDHILLFNEKISPYKDYVYGGRCAVTIDLKIASILTGEVVYQSMQSFGGYYDIKKAGADHMFELPTSTIGTLRAFCLAYLSYELIYAIGGWEAGAVLVPNDTAIAYVLPNSLADRAGVQARDRVIEINGMKVHSETDLRAVAKNIKQGDEIRAKIERGGKTLEFSSKIPQIPFKPEEEKKHKPVDKKMQL